ncbi:MAG: DUF2703 domain-containing protein [Nitrososphaerota archaeon]|nr:DUF2703 domain-containing protein [Aigarchaeota archaeon]MDW8076811.1 DUF2703 domain-containing protein [Nitrososphaerota archaeon]
MNVLKIRWQRLSYGGQTCPRCESTGEEIERAASILKQILEPLGVEVVVEKYDLSVDEFRENPLESNRIWIEGRPIEEWLSGRVGQSPCCDVCEPYECRTIELDGKVYETITSDLIVKAGVLAALNLINRPCFDP